MTVTPDDLPPEMTVTVPENIDATLTVTARLEGRGLLISLKSEGDFSGETIDRRFYSIPHLPPAGLDPALFWATVLDGISGLLGADDEG